MTTNLRLELARLRAIGKSGRTKALKALGQRRETIAAPIANRQAPHCRTLATVATLERRFKYGAGPDDKKAGPRRLRPCRQ